MSGKPSGTPACTVCAVALDQWNRYGHRLLCRFHGQEMDRRRKVAKPRKVGQAVGSSAPDPRSSATGTDPDRELRALLRAAIPPQPFRVIGLYRNKDHELAVRLRRAMAAPQETYCTDPTDRTRAGLPLLDHGEFLAMADNYGVRLHANPKKD
jgi:hypothetical protein